MSIQPNPHVLPAEYIFWGIFEPWSNIAKLCCRVLKPPCSVPSPAGRTSAWILEHPWTHPSKLDQGFMQHRRVVWLLPMSHQSSSWSSEPRKSHIYTSKGQIPTATVNIQSAASTWRYTSYNDGLSLKTSRGARTPQSRVSSHLIRMLSSVMSRSTITGKFPPLSPGLPGCVSCRLHLTRAAGKLSKATW